MGGGSSFPETKYPAWYNIEDVKKSNGREKVDHLFSHNCNDIFSMFLTNFRMDIEVHSLIT